MGKTKYKIGIWGQFGDGGQIADGQAVRTTIITNEIKDRYNTENVKIVNTNNWSKKPFSFLLKSIMLVVQTEKIVIFPADNGFKIIVPLLTISNLLFRRELYYIVIGGFLPELLRKKRKYIKALKKFIAIFVQTDNLKKDLESFGLDNIYILSNLKKIEKINESELRVNNEKHISVCTLSRVTYTKGIEDAIEGVRRANNKLGEKLVSLDIYGVVDKHYKEAFEDLLSKNIEFVTYKGVAYYDKTVNVMKNYFSLLFPTFFHGEGFSGNIIDSFFSGLPVIATDWLYNKDVIIDGLNGIIVPVNNPEAISEALLHLYEDRELAYKIARNNLCEADKYTPEIVLQKLYDFLDK